VPELQRLHHLPEDLALARRQDSEGWEEPLCGRIDVFAAVCAASDLRFTASTIPEVPWCSTDARRVSAWSTVRRFAWCVHQLRIDTLNDIDPAFASRQTMLVGRSSGAV
jgi:hypothetical protein